MSTKANTIIEPDGTNGQHKVMAQDSTVGVPVFYGTYTECLQWQKENQ